jgi:elongation factor 1-gamma
VYRGTSGQWFQPNFKKVIGEVKQAEAVPAIQKKVASPAKRKDVNKEALKEAPKSVVEAPKEEAPKPKPKNPLDLLPPSKMVLDDWKRLYWNTKSNLHEVAVKLDIWSSRLPLMVLLLSYTNGAQIN